MTTIHSTQLSQAVVIPTEPPTEGPQGHNPNQTDRDCSDDDFNSPFVRVVIHNLSQGGTVREEPEDFDHSTNWRGADTSELANSTGLLQFLNSCDQLLENTDLDNDDDDIISCMRECHLTESYSYGESGWRTPDHSPHNHFNFNYAVPYETSQEARDRLLNHNDVLAEENKRLRQQLQEQNVARGR